MTQASEPVLTFAIRLDGRGSRDTHAVQRALIHLAERLDLRSDEEMAVRIVGRELRITLTPEGRKRLEAAGR